MVLDEILQRGVAEVIEKESMLKKLRSGRKLRIKYGIDPTSPDIHLGHAVPMRKLKEFQDLGHQIVIILGDFTAQIGDPSGLSKTRVALSEKEVKENAEKYFAQAFKILDKDKTEVHGNSEWFSKMKLSDFISLLSKISANTILSHETFKKRLEKNLSLAMHELVYPVLQGYDSVVLKADVEIGGLDQKFNLLMGRYFQKIFNQPEQEVMMTKYLLGTDGKEKMSKSLKNYIAILESPAEMYGKVMSIPDSLILPYFELCTNISAKGLDLVKKEYQEAKNRRNLKAKLAKLICETYHNLLLAEKAEEEFEKVFRHKVQPTNIPTVKVREKFLPLVDLLVGTKMVSSRSEAKRLILQKAVKLSGEVLSDPFIKVQIKDGLVLQVGKRKFKKITTKVQKNYENTKK